MRRTRSFYRAVAERNGGSFELFIPQQDPELAFSYAEWAAGAQHMKLVRVQFAGRSQPTSIGQWRPVDPDAVFIARPSTPTRSRAPKTDPRQGNLF